MSITKTQPDGFLVNRSLIIRNGDAVTNIIPFAGNPNNQVLSPAPNVSDLVVDTTTGNIYRFISGVVYEKIGDHSVLESRLITAETVLVTTANRVTAAETDISDLQTEVTNNNDYISNVEDQVESNDTDIADHETRIAALEATTGGSGGWSWNISGHGASNIQWAVNSVAKKGSYYMTVRAPIVLECRGASGEFSVANLDGNNSYIGGNGEVLSLFPGEYKVYTKREGDLVLCIHSYCGFPALSVGSTTAWNAIDVIDNGLLTWNGVTPRGEDIGSI